MNMKKKLFDFRKTRFTLNFVVELLKRWRTINRTRKKLLCFVFKRFLVYYTCFFYKNTENGARLDVLSISRFQSLKMFLKCS